MWRVAHVWKLIFGQIGFWQIALGALDWLEEVKVKQSGWISEIQERFRKVGGQGLTLAESKEWRTVGSRTVGPGRVVRSSLIGGEWDWTLTQATLPDTSQTLPASPPHPPFLLTIIVTLAEQLQESEQVLGEFIICHDLLSWVEGGGVRHGPEDIRCAKTPESVHTAHAHCTHMHKEQVRREQQPPF